MAKENIQAFWGDLYKQLYAENDASLSPESLERQIDELEDLFKIREQSCVVEMPLEDLAGKTVLEIGSGAGGHSCIFKRHGADVTAIDITPERVISTAAKLDMLKGGSGRAMQADAENLPFDDDSFDIVYSNSVLHQLHRYGTLHRRGDPRAEAEWTGSDHTVFAGVGGVHVQYLAARPDRR